MKYYSVIFCLILSFIEVHGQDNEVISFTEEIFVQHGQLHKTYHYIIQVNSKSGDWAANISIPYKKGNKPNLLEAYITNRYGKTVRKLKKKEVSDLSQNSRGVFYQDNFIKKFTLKHNEYPYRIHYSYEERLDEFVYVTRWYPLVHKSMPVKYAKLTVSVADDYEVFIKYDTTKFKYDTYPLEGKTFYSWEIKDINTWSKEILAPPIWETLPSVVITPKKFVYGNTQGSTESWGTYGAWVEELNKGLDELPPDEQSKVQALIKGKRNKKEVIDILYRYMQQHTRYINVSIEDGGLRPYPASYVCKNKYGDCKALTVYMKALLKEAGITSHYADVYAGDSPKKIDTEQAGQQFNHVILCVPLQDNDTLWLENTANYLPTGYLGTFTQNRKVLLVDGQQSQLVQTPKLELAAVKNEAIYHYYPDAYGHGKVDISYTFRGEAFETLQYIEKNLSERDKKRSQSDFIPIKSHELTRWEVVRPDSSKAMIMLEASVTARNLLRKIGKSFIVENKTMQLPKLEMPQERQNPIVVNYPIYEVHTSIFHLDSLQGDVEIPEDISIASKYGEFSQTFQLEQGLITIQTRFIVYSDRYSLQEYTAFFNFIHTIEEKLSQSVLIVNPIQR